MASSALAWSSPAQLTPLLTPPASQRSQPPNTSSTLHRSSSKVDRSAVKVIIPNLLQRKLTINNRRVLAMSQKMTNSLMGLLQVADKAKKLQFLQTLDSDARIEVFQQQINSPHTAATEVDFCTIIKAAEQEEGGGLALFESVPVSKLLKVVFSFGKRYSLDQLLKILSAEMKIYLLESLAQKPASVTRNEKLLLLFNRVGTADDDLEKAQRKAMEALTSEAAATLFNLLFKTQKGGKNKPMGDNSSIGTCLEDITVPKTARSDPGKNSNSRSRASSTVGPTLERYQDEIVETIDLSLESDGDATTPEFLDDSDGESESLEQHSNTLDFENSSQDFIELDPEQSAQVPRRRHSDAEPGDGDDSQNDLGSESDEEDTITIKGWDASPPRNERQPTSENIDSDDNSDGGSDHRGISPPPIRNSHKISETDAHPAPLNRRWRTSHKSTPAATPEQHSEHSTKAPLSPGKNPHKTTHQRSRYESDGNHDGDDSDKELDRDEEHSGDESSTSASADTKRRHTKTNLKITQESLCYRMGFTTIDEHSDYRSMLRQAKQFCTMINFNISWEANDPEARESEIDRLHEWWGHEYNFPRDLTVECLRVCCGWPEDLVPGDKINPEVLLQNTLRYRGLVRKLTPDSLQYRMGFTSETAMHRTAYLRRRQTVKEMVSGVNWLIPYSHQHETVRRTSLDRVFQVWGPEFGYSKELCNEVLKTLCANGSSVAGRAPRAEYRKVNPSVPLKRGRKPRSVVPEMAPPVTPANVLKLPRMKVTPRQSLSALTQDDADAGPSLINRIMRKTNSSNLPSIHAGTQLSHSSSQRSYSSPVVGQTPSHRHPSRSNDSNEATPVAHPPIRLDHIDRPIPPALSARLYAASQPSQVPRVRKSAPRTRPPSSEIPVPRPQKPVSSKSRQEQIDNHQRPVPAPATGAPLESSDSDASALPRQPKRQRATSTTSKVTSDGQPQRSSQDKRRIELAKKKLSAQQSKSTAKAKARKKSSEAKHGKGKQVDIPDSTESEATPIPDPPAKRGRGRPRGSKSKSTTGQLVEGADARPLVAVPVPTEGLAGPSVIKKRGRPPNQKKKTPAPATKPLESGIDSLELDSHGRTEKQGVSPAKGKSKATSTNLISKPTTTLATLTGNAKPLRRSQRKQV